MNLSQSPTGARRVRSRAVGVASLAAVFSAGLLIAVTGGAQAAHGEVVPLGTAKSFAVLAGAAITDVPASVITGDVGLSPTTGAAIGLTCGEVDGEIYSVDAAGPLPCRITNAALLTTAKNDLGDAYDDAAAQTPDDDFGVADNQLGGDVLTPGVYRFGHAATANLIGNLTLNGGANGVWVFQATSDLVTAAASTITLTGGAQACNVFWQVTSSATLGANSSFVGTVLALTSITVESGATVQGRVLARNGAVTLDQNTITRPRCNDSSPDTTTDGTTTAAPSTTTTAATPATTPATTTTATTSTTTTVAAPTPAPPSPTTTTATTPAPTVKPITLPAGKPTVKPGTKPSATPASKPTAKPTAKPRAPTPVPAPRTARRPFGFTG